MRGGVVSICATGDMGKDDYSTRKDERHRNLSCAWQVMLAAEKFSHIQSDDKGNKRREWLISNVSDISEGVESLRSAASKDKDHD